jgi:hypothetical protein
MTEIHSSYQTGVGREQGGEHFFITGAGEFKFYDVDWTGKALRNFIGSFFAITALGESGVGISGPHSPLSLYYGTYFFSLGSDLSLGSANLPSAWKGARLVLDGTSMIGDARIIFDASAAGGGMAGVSLEAKNGLALSSIVLSAGGNAKLFCATEGIWTVYECNTATKQQI